MSMVFLPPLTGVLLFMDSSKDFGGRRHNLGITCDLTDLFSVKFRGYATGPQNPPELPT
jgi:hypothetical protein